MNTGQMSPPKGYRRHRKYRMLMTLSQGQANRNKFYQLELWTKPKVRRVYLVARWGRIGATGRTQCKRLATLEQGIERFQRMRKAKGKKGYLRIQTSGRCRHRGVAQQQLVPPSPLTADVRSLVRRVFKECKGWTQKHLQIQYKDAHMATPFGALHAEQLEQGRQVLQALKQDMERSLWTGLDATQKTVVPLSVTNGVLYAELQKDNGEWVEASVTVPPVGKMLVNQNGSFQVVPQRADQASDHARVQAEQQAMLVRLSNRYFSLIPHKFGLKKPPLLNSPKAVLRELQLLQQLEDLNRLLLRDSQSLQTTDVVRQYASLGCDISVVPPQDAVFAQLQKEVLPLQLRRLFRVRREQEHQAFRADDANIQLLFHGSRMHNWLGLLAKGMLLPKQVQATGVTLTDAGWLGRGLYFGNADTASKYTTKGGGKTAFLLASEVAMGRVFQTRDRDFSLTAAPEGYDSCHGLQRTPEHDSQFTEDEYVVYQAERKRMAFLLEVEGPTGTYAY